MIKKILIFSSIPLVICGQAKNWGKILFCSKVAATALSIIIPEVIMQKYIGNDLYKDRPKSMEQILQEFKEFDLK